MSFKISLFQRVHNSDRGVYTFIYDHAQLPHKASTYQVHVFKDSCGKRFQIKFWNNRVKGGIKAIQEFLKSNLVTRGSVITFTNDIRAFAIPSSYQKGNSTDYKELELWPGINSIMTLRRPQLDLLTLPRVKISGVEPKGKLHGFSINLFLLGDPLVKKFYPGPNAEQCFEFVYQATDLYHLIDVHSNYRFDGNFLIATLFDVSATSEGNCTTCRLKIDGASLFLTNTKSLPDAFVVEDCDYDVKVLPLTSSAKAGVDRTEEKPDQQPPNPEVVQKSHPYPEAIQKSQLNPETIQKITEEEPDGIAKDEIEQEAESFSQKMNLN